MHITSLWRHLLFNFLKTSIFLLLIRDYQHTKFGIIWVKESKVTEGGESAPQVENVLNRPGEIGLSNSINDTILKISEGQCWVEKYTEVNASCQTQCGVWAFSHTPIQKFSGLTFTLLSSELCTPAILKIKLLLLNGCLLSGLFQTGKVQT